MQNILGQSSLKEKQSHRGIMAKKVAVQKRNPHSDETKRKIGLKNSKPKIKKICCDCGKYFLVHPCREKKAKYCSRVCQRKNSLNTGIPWNKGLKGVMNAWNKGKKCPQWSGEKHSNWKGGRFCNSQGYVFVYSPNHPLKSNDGYVLEHRLVMEKKIGRYLTKKEVVHHINENKGNNKISNLMLFNCSADHLKHHAEVRNVSKK